MEKKELCATAAMAQLVISEAEAGRLANAVSEILDYFAIMQNVDTEGLEPTTHALLSVNRLREDEIKKYTNKEFLLKNAPELEDEFISIPNVL